MNFKNFAFYTLAVIALAGCKSQNIETVNEFRKEPITIEAKSLNSSLNSYKFSGVDKNGQVYTASLSNCFNFKYYQIGTQYLIPIKTTKKIKKTEEGNQIISTEESLSPCGENAQITNKNNVEAVQTLS